MESALKIPLTGKKEDDYHGVDDGKPVNLYVTHSQVCIPTGRPFDKTLLQIKIQSVHFSVSASPIHV